MIYEGAVIRRLVTPNHPGDPTLDDPKTEIQYRVEYVKDDVTAPAPGSWTREMAEAHRYPTHLAADHRAKEIGGNCFARVVPRETETDFITQDGEAVSRLAHNQKIVGSTPTPATNLSGGDKLQPDVTLESLHQSMVAAPLTPRANGRTEYRGENRAGSGSSVPPAQNILPVESGLSDRASKRPRSNAPRVEVGVDSRAAGKSFSKRKAKPGRLEALRASKASVAAAASDDTWWRTGQYA